MYSKPGPTNSIMYVCLSLTASASSPMVDSLLCTFHNEMYMGYITPQ